MSELQVGGLGPQYVIECIQLSGQGKAGEILPFYEAWATVTQSLTDNDRSAELKQATFVTAKKAEEASNKAEELLGMWLLNERRYRARPVAPLT